jgi:hypothetical protein
MVKDIFTRINIIRFGLLVAAVTLITLSLPRNGHQSFSYELNQPWKYHLLTADFDIPIYNDEASMQRLTDSIDKNFIPFVIRDNNVSRENIERFSKITAAKEPHADYQRTANLLYGVYSRGIMQPELYDSVMTRKQYELRTIQDNSDNPTTATTINIAGMFTPARAYHYIDSLYRAAHSDNAMTQDMAKALNLCLVPNIILDTVTDGKFRSQEYLNVNAAQGVIKKGQRIVDMGEIVTPQIYTNLSTYEQMLEDQQLDNNDSYYIVGQIMLILTVYLLFYLFLAKYRYSYFSSIRIVTFLMSFSVLFVLFAIFMFDNFSYGIYVVPFTAVPIIVLIFFDSRTAVMTMLTTVLISALVATFHFQFIFMEFMAGLVATFSLRQLSRRSQLLTTAMLVFATYVVTYVASLIFTDGNLNEISYRAIGMLAVNCVLISFAYFLVLLLEKIFGFTSTVTLVELSDINNRLLRQLSEEAPGTFQHSMQVSTLASDAARAINANVQMVRTGALYHDIGKLASPIFFTENQHGVNPHDGLTPEASAHKIISHISAGLQLAAKEKLPAVIRAFITEHHGLGVAKYFYNTAINSGYAVNRADFQYPGPNPRSKETTIVMMADSVEAASRSLAEYSEESISKLVESIIDGQIAEGLYVDSPISFHDIAVIKETFKARLSTIYHSRVAYPKLHDTKQENKENNKDS